VLAFKKYELSKGIMGSPFVGFYNFKRFFSSPDSLRIIFNTIKLSVYSLIAGFPFPIILALCVNYCLSKWLKKSVQSITFAPYFLSTVIMVGLLAQLLSLRSGLVNVLLSYIGLEQVNFMGEVSLFNDLYVWSGIWQGTGYSAVIYIAALSGVDPTYHEAAIIDGASIWKRIWHIDLPTIRKTIIILVILSMGSVLNVGFEKVYLMQNPLNLASSEIISTYVYKVSIQSMRPDFSFGTAIGLFQNVVALALTLAVNFISNKVSDEGLF
jgi:multiple sugar transport system permease protein/putative aldouronate transport system permease protein